MGLTGRDVASVVGKARGFSGAGLGSSGRYRPRSRARILAAYRARAEGGISVARMAGGLLTSLLVMSTGSTAIGQSVVSATAQDEIKFIGVFQDKDTTAADDRLAKFLGENIGQSGLVHRPPVRFQKQTMPYGEVIRKFAEWDERKNEGAYLARITPYAYVAAEMLGAQFDILAIYNSAATGSTTYHSYFVVNKKDITEVLPHLGASTAPPTPDSLADYLKEITKSRPAKFIYHDRFSTSSYFLPSIYFRAHHIFATSQSAGGDLIPIRVEKLPGGGSSALVKEVAAARADLAAVWDGTKAKFDKGGQSEEDGKNVYFIELPTELPNDLLVCSRWLSPVKKDAIRGAIRDHPAAGRERNHKYKDDFESWLSIDGVPGTTLEALAKLRQSARERPAPVTVNIAKTSVREEYLDAARQAVRLAGTEFVLYDEDLHRRVDVTWKLESTHDRAINLKSKIEGSDLPEDAFPISFMDKNDLPKRIADLMHSRMRRIRYIWSYEEKYPAVIRDLDFEPATDVTVQRISWTDPDAHEYEQDTPFRARVVRVDFNKLQLSDENQFPKNADGSLNFEPMSNVAYRVILTRKPRPGWIWLALPWVFIGAMVLAAGGFALDLRRRRPPPKGFHETYQRMVEEYHRPWRECEIDEGDVLWCDSAYMAELIKELRRESRFMDLVRAGGLDFSLGPIPVRFSTLTKIFDGIFRRRLKLPPELAESSEVGSVAAIDNLVKFLVGRRRLSPFIGFPEQAAAAARLFEKPMEWEALDDIASRHFRQLGIAQKPVDASLRRDSQVLSAAVASHFQEVIRRGKRDVSFFRQSWQIDEKEGRYRLIHTEDLGGELRLTTQGGGVTRVTVVVQFSVRPEPSLRDSLGGKGIEAWVLGKIVERSASNGDGVSSLWLQFRPIALLKDHAQQ